MRFKVVVEQRKIGFIEVDVPDDEWNAHASYTVRRKLVKKAAANALSDGAEIDWQNPDPIEPTTSYFLLG